MRESRLRYPRPDFLSHNPTLLDACAEGLLLSGSPGLARAILYTDPQPTIPRRGARPALAFKHAFNLTFA
jgi:hypothetical protein